VAYADFYAGLPPAAAVWRRQMVLGPAPEFCAAGALEVPGGLRITRRRVRALGSGTASAG